MPFPSENSRCLSHQPHGFILDREDSKDICQVWLSYNPISASGGHFSPPGAWCLPASISAGLVLSCCTPECLNSPSHPRSRLCFSRQYQTCWVALSPPSQMRSLLNDSHSWVPYELMNNSQKIQMNDWMQWNCLWFCMCSHILFTPLYPMCNWTKDRMTF